MNFFTRFFSGVILLISLLLVKGQQFGGPCPNNCQSRGRCRIPGQVCDCFNGFTGPDCSLRSCPMGPAWNDIAHGSCLCRSGYEGAACQRMACPGQCSSFGACLSMNSYSRTKDPGFGTVFVYNDIWNANMTQGCRCDSGFTGPDCSVRACPSGDDPFTGKGLITSDPIQLNTIQTVNCRGGTGTFTLAFRGETTLPISWDSKQGAIVTALEALPNIGFGGVAVILYASSACAPSGQSYFQVEFLQDFGTLPLLVTDYTNLGFDSFMVVSVLQFGTKEDVECSGRGICDFTSGICSCFTDFDTSDGYGGAGTRGDCGWYASKVPLQTCPGIVSCTGHGVCLGSPTYKCKCSEGWTGADCSMRACPYSLSWYTYPSADNEAHLYDLVECGNAGVCDRTSGLCVCNNNFEGSACEFMSCPGDTQACNGHGQCLDMKTLATFATIDGQLVKKVISSTVTRIGYIYGTTPNDPATWDATSTFEKSPLFQQCISRCTFNISNPNLSACITHLSNRIKGCLCDNGFGGYDCSLVTCPFGDDPSTINQVDEVQTISCESDLRGTVTFSFRDQSSVEVAESATFAQITSALQAVSTIGKVKVSLNALSNDNNRALCATAPDHKVDITFLQVHGSIPILQTKASSIGAAINVVRKVKGTKENIECSGRGICNYLFGQCNCFAGYGSSDGMGNPGTVGDCGNILQDAP